MGKGNIERKKIHAQRVAQKRISCMVVVRPLLQWRWRIIITGWSEWIHLGAYITGTCTLLFRNNHAKRKMWEKYSKGHATLHAVCFNWMHVWGPDFVAPCWFESCLSFFHVISKSKIARSYFCNLNLSVSVVILWFLDNYEHLNPDQNSTISFLEPNKIMYQSSNWKPPEKYRAV